VIAITHFEFSGIKLAHIPEKWRSSTSGQRVDSRPENWPASLVAPANCVFQRNPSVGESMEAGISEIDAKTTHPMFRGG
jgi:hypothetical protein